MTMKEIYIICLLICLIAIYVEGGKPPCTCVPLNECDAIKKALTRPTRKSFRMFKKSLCGFHDNTYKVCCPRAKLPSKCGGSFGDRTQRIFGGQIASIGMYPWMAIFEYESFMDKKNFGCGGSLINNRYVISAAHCFVNQKIYSVRLGDWDLSSDVDCEEGMYGKFCAPRHVEQRVTQDQVLVHPMYHKRSPYSDDVALVRLRRAIDLEMLYPFIQPICVPPQGIDVKMLMKNTKHAPMAAGWGSTKDSPQSKVLRYVDLNIVSGDKCKELFPDEFTDTQICAGGQEGKDSCTGDSGGPLFIKGPNGPPYLQLGIVSFGMAQCGTDGAPAVYTSLTHYRKWIDENIFI